MTSEPQQKRAVAIFGWLATPDEACTCENCNYNIDRCGCEDYRRELVTRVRPGFGVKRDQPEDVYIREWHSGECQFVDYVHDGATRLNPLPNPRAFGPRNRFEPMHAVDALFLKTERWPDGSWLYRAFGEDGELLYIGITQGVAKRMRGHRKSSGWWPQCHYVELEVHPDRKAARDAERRAIRMELPRFNVAD